jgi:hypothetical protein
MGHLTPLSLLLHHVVGKLREWSLPGVERLRSLRGISRSPRPFSLTKWFLVVEECYSCFTAIIIIIIY